MVEVNKELFGTYSFGVGKSSRAPACSNLDMLTCDERIANVGRIKTLLFQ